jgi:uncharacterized protein YkwD
MRLESLITLALASLALASPINVAERSAAAEPAIDLGNLGNLDLGSLGNLNDLITRIRSGDIDGLPILDLGSIPKGDAVRDPNAWKTWVQNWLKNLFPGLNIPGDGSGIQITISGGQAVPTFAPGPLPTPVEPQPNPEPTNALPGGGDIPPPNSTPVGIPSESISTAAPESTTSAAAPQSPSATQPTTTAAGSPITPPAAGSPTPPTSTATPSGTTTATPANAYAARVVAQHNLHRSNHSAPSVTFDASLAAAASVLAARCTFAHDTSINGGGYGQNLAITGSTSDQENQKDPAVLAAAAVTNQWYNQEMSSFLDSYYGQATPSLDNFEAWGHFSQVVWKASTRIGCATQYCPKSSDLFGEGGSAYNGWYTVCNYLEPGNFGGRYGDNIGRPLGRATVTV